MTLPTPHRRAELRGLPGRDTLTNAELTALLDATEPVTDAEVVEEAAWLQGLAERHRMERFARLAALIERLARELAETRSHG